MNKELELAANIAEAANFATYFTANPPASSTPHLYISALATWSTGSTMSQKWREKFPHIPSFTHRKASDVPLMTIPTDASISSVTFSSDGIRIVSGSSDNSVRVWDASTGAELKVLNGHTGSVLSTAFSSDGTCIVSGSYDKSVRVWDALTGAELKVLNGHTDTVWSTAFSSDGTRIVSGSSDNSVRVWDALTGTELKVLNGHTGPVWSTAFSSDGTRIVSGSDDRSVRVWDASTGVQLKVPNLDTSSLNSVASFIHNTSITLDDDSAQSSSVANDYSAWTITPKLWILSVHDGYRLMWVPEAAYPYSILVISRNASAHINFQDCKIGCDWIGCYADSYVRNMNVPR